MHPHFLFHILSGVLMIVLFFTGAFLLLRYYLQQSKITAPVVPAGEDHRLLMPLRLQAYERIVMFLERISPQNLVMRLNAPELSALQFQSLLVRTIREEFEYNLSQQIYVSPKAWEMVKQAKEEMVAMINKASGRMAPDAPSATFIRAVFEVAMEGGKLPSEEAIDQLKRELQKFF
jgi:hypothetical protein